MRSYRSAFTCALALISSISAVSSLQIAAVDELVSSITAAGSLPTEIASVPTDVEKAISTADVVSEVASAISSVASEASKDSLPTGVVSSVVGSATAVVSSSFPSDILSALQLTTLGCKYGSSVISGMTDLVELSTSETSSVPTFFTSSSLTGAYILMMIDPDVTSPQILHFMQTGMVSSSSSNSTNSSSIPLSASEPAAVKYLGPAPPAGSGVHRYTMFLFEQPLDFTLPEGFDTSKRSGFDIASFATKSGLGIPVAATFFGAQNSSGNFTNGAAGNSTGRFSNGTYTNSTRIGSSYNGTTIPDSFRGNSTNGTLLGSSPFGNSTSNGNSTIPGSNRNGTLTSGTGNSTSGSGNSSMISSSASSPLSSDDESDDESDISSSTGPVPISPTAVADSASANTDPNGISTGGSSANLASFALAGFVGLVTAGVTYL